MLGASPLPPSPSAAIGAFGCQSLDLGTRSGHCGWSRGRTQLTPLRVTEGLQKSCGNAPRRVGLWQCSVLLWGEPGGALSSPQSDVEVAARQGSPEPPARCARSPGCHPGPPGPQAVPPSRAPLPAQWPGAALGGCHPLRHPTAEAHFQGSFCDGRAATETQHQSCRQEPRVVPAPPHNWWQSLSASPAFGDRGTRGSPAVLLPELGAGCPAGGSRARGDSGGTAQRAAGCSRGRAAPRHLRSLLPGMGKVLGPSRSSWKDRVAANTSWRGFLQRFGEGST